MSFISPIAVPSASTSSIAFASTKLLAATLSKGDRRQETGAGSLRLGIFPKAKERWTTAFLLNSGTKTKRPQPRSIRERPRHRRMRRSGTKTRASHFTPTALPMPGKSCCGIAKVFGWPFVLTLLPLEFTSSSWSASERQAAKRGVLAGGNHVRNNYSWNRFGRTYPRDHDRRQFKQGVRTPNHGRFDGGG